MNTVGDVVAIASTLIACNDRETEIDRILQSLVHSARQKIFTGFPDLAPIPFRALSTSSKEVKNQFGYLGAFDCRYRNQSDWYGNSTEIHVVTAVRYIEKVINTVRKHFTGLLADFLEITEDQTSSSLVALFATFHEYGHGWDFLSNYDGARERDSGKSFCEDHEKSRTLLPHGKLTPMTFQKHLRKKAYLSAATKEQMIWEQSMMYMNLPQERFANEWAREQMSRFGYLRKIA